MVEAPTWFVWMFNIMIGALIILVLLFIGAWLNAKKTEGKMMAEIWEPSGFAPRHLVKPDPTGATVTVDNIIYRLPRELSQRELETHTHVYPSRRYITYKPFLGLKFLQSPVRIESWERDNPEPIRPFYGRVDKDGKFIDNQLTVTSTEWAAQKSVIQATGIAMSVQEREAREKEWERGMRNLPNKMVLYIGIGIAALASILCAVLTYQIVGWIG